VNRQFPAKTAKYKNYNISEESTSEMQLMNWLNGHNSTVWTLTATKLKKWCSCPGARNQLCYLQFHQRLFSECQCIRFLAQRSTPLLRQKPERDCGLWNSWGVSQDDLIFYYQSVVRPVLE